MKWGQDTQRKISTLINTAVITKDLSWYRKVVIPKMTKAYGMYKAVENSTGVPAAMVAMIHARENASDLGKFDAYLGNGQSWKRKTTIVPRGRGPFKSWESGAIDALTLMGLHKIKTWDLTRVLYECERYNGFGYYNRGIQSPYVWSGTEHYKKGKYVRDGVFDRNAVDQNVGVFCYYKMLIEADIRFAIKRGDFTNVGSPELPQEQPGGLKSILEQFFQGLGKLLGWIFGQPKTDQKAHETKYPHYQTELDRILANSPGIGPKMTKMALSWVDNPQVKNKAFMVLVDFDLHESQPRLYVVDRETGKSEAYKVAHGSKSDPNKDGKTDYFSNESGSNMSSLGAMVLTNQYGNADGGWSKFPYACKIQGIQPPLNNKVADRAIVFHSSKYVNDEVGKSIGDSLGCFAVSEKTAKSIIDKIDDGCLLFAYHRSLDNLNL